MRTTWILCVLPAGLALVLGFCGQMSAANFDWQGAGTGVNSATDVSDCSTWWDRNANWVGGSGYPKENDTASFSITNAGYCNARTNMAAYVYLDGVSAGGALHISGTDNLAVLHNMDVGHASYGQVIQDGGRNVVTDNLSIARLIGSSGTYRLEGGYLRSGSYGAPFQANETYLGHAGTGHFIQKGGQHDTNLNLYLGFAGTGIGTYQLDNGSLNVGVGPTLGGPTMYVGYSGTGTFTQNGGTVTASPGGFILMAWQSGSQGTYTLNDGAINDCSTYVGGLGTATFTQNGGSVSSLGNFIVGSGTGSHGEVLLTKGTLTTGMTNVGSSGSGKFTQTGGTHTTGLLVLPWSDASPTGTYDLQDGDLITGNEFYRGGGTFTQTGGNHKAGGGFQMSGGSGKVAKYNLQTGSFTDNGTEHVGYSGAAEFTQTGGTHEVKNAVNLGYQSAGNGTYALSVGALSSGSLNVGYSGTGTFTHTSGTNTVKDNATIGCAAGSTGTYTLSTGSFMVGKVLKVADCGTGTLNVDGGSLVTGDFLVGTSDGKGKLKVTNPSAYIEVTGALTFGKRATLDLASGTTIHMTGAGFLNQSDNELALNALNNLNLIFEGGPASLDLFEAASIDNGANGGKAWTNNFALGTLAVGSADNTGFLRLVDDFNNGNRLGIAGDNEAVYVDRLVLTGGSTLDMNHLHLYYRTFDDFGGTILNGAPTQIPEPGTLALLALGSCATALLRRRRTT